MNYKALVLDLDGTLMTSSNQISDKTRDSLIKIQQQGIKVILASGRPTHGLLKASQVLRLKEFGGYLLSYNGGSIIDEQNEKVLFDSYLETEMVLELFHQSRKLGTHFLAYNDQFILTEDDDEYIQLESRINELPIVRVPDVTEEIKHTSVKCLMTGEPTHLESVEKEMIEIYKDQLSISRSMPFFLECMPKGINKGNCLKILLDHLTINPENVIACGDGYNDISLIEAAGLGVAMANGCEPIKEKADYITLSNDEDGICHVIEEFILI